MCMKNSIELKEENQGKLFRIFEIMNLCNISRSVTETLIDKLNLISKSGKAKLYDEKDVNKIKECVVFKKYFESLYSINDIHKICKIANGSVENIIKDLQLKGVTYYQFTRYTEDELKQIQKFIEEHPNSKTYFYEKTCVKMYGVKNVFLRKDVKDKAVKNSHTLECIDKQNKNKEEHYKDEGGYANHMSNIGKERWKNYTEEEKENTLLNMQNGVIEKHGVDNCSKLDWVKEKKKITTMNSIGFDNPLKDRERLKQGMLNKYGVDHNSHDKKLLAKRVATYKERLAEYNATKNENSELKFDDKSKKTKIEKYGEDYVSKFADKGDKTKRKLYGDDYGKKFWNKADETCRELYGNDYREKLTKKSMETNRKNHGGLHNTQTKESQEKMKQTYFEHTGYYHPSQNPKTRRNHRTCYYYDDEEFDSSWELAYYIYLKDYNIPFEYHTISIPYVWNDKIHYYKVDFKVYNRLVEIKGDHILVKNVFKDDGRSQAKYECMKENNVLILMETDIKPYLKYVKDKYGKNYMKSFRKKYEDKK